VLDPFFGSSGGPPGSPYGPGDTFVVTDPETGARLKTLYVPDARFKPPAFEGRVQQKQEPTFEWTSDGGVLQVFEGARP